MTNLDKIIQALQRRKTRWLSGYDFFNLLNITSYTKPISILRARGLPIVDEWKESKTKKRYKVYKLAY